MYIYDDADSQEVDPWGVHCIVAGLCGGLLAIIVWHFISGPNERFDTFTTIQYYLGWALLIILTVGSSVHFMYVTRGRSLALRLVSILALWGLYTLNGIWWTQHVKTKLDMGGTMLSMFILAPLLAMAMLRLLRSDVYREFGLNKV